MKNVAVIFFMLFVFTLFSKAEAKPITIAVIDTGFDFNSTWEDAEKMGLAKPKLCKFGHKDFTIEKEHKKLFEDTKKLMKKNKTIDSKDIEELELLAYKNEKLRKKHLQDNHGHGTHVAGIIAKHLKNVDYCLVIVKYYDPKIAGANNLKNTIKSFKYARQIKVDYINYSGGGLESSGIEKAEILKLLNLGVKIFTASGNEGSDLSKKPYYPASYDPRIFVIGNRTKSGGKQIKVNGEQISIAKTSNYGNIVDSYEYGTNIFSIGPNNGYRLMTGTSQAAPKALADEVLRNTDIKK